MKQESVPVVLNASEKIVSFPGRLLFFVAFLLFFVFFVW